MQEESESQGVDKEEEGSVNGERSDDESEDEFASIPYQPLVDTDDEEAAQDFGYSLIGHSHPGGQIFSSDDEVEIEVGYMHFGADKEDDLTEKELEVIVEDEVKEKTDNDSQEQLNIEEIERRITELELQTDEGSVSVTSSTTTTTASRVPPPKKKEFSLESPFPSPIDADQAVLLKKQALDSFDAKYQKEVNSGAVSIEKREELFPELSKEHVDDIKAAMQGFTLSLPPMDIGQDSKWQELLNKRKKKGN